MEIKLNSDNENRECSHGTGNENDFNTKECRSSAGDEDLCIFPFYWNGKLFDQCTFLNVDNFLFPVFRCPTRNITRKIDGINSFIYDDIIKQVG